MLTSKDKTRQEGGVGGVEMWDGGQGNLCLWRCIQHPAFIWSIYCEKKLPDGKSEGTSEVSRGQRPAHNDGGMSPSFLKELLAP